MKHIYIITGAVKYLKAFMNLIFITLILYTGLQKMILMKVIYKKINIMILTTGNSLQKT